jgi:hypothetical protein
MLHTEPDGGALLRTEARAKTNAPETIKLPAPDLESGKSLMQALRDRHTSREFSAKAVPMTVISNLLWAAFGINRAGGGRTAPSAHEWHEIDVYVASADGLYLYDARNHSLRLVLAQDIRIKTGLQSFVADAPLNLV